MVSADAGNVERCLIAAPSLEGNLLGDPASVSAMVLLPDGYATSTKRYPVVHLLAGFGEPADPLAMGIAWAEAVARSSIVVVVSGRNLLGGSFYVDSPVSGNWDAAITKDVVGYVDATYRTIARREARGLAGVSMGGSGALDVAMRHPELFAAVFAEVPGIFDATGSERRLYDEAIVRDILAFEKGLAGKSLADRAAALGRYAAGASEDLQFELAYGAAFAPDPSADLLMNLPFRERDGRIERDEATWRRWVAGFGDVDEKIRAHKASWLRYEGIAVDWGTQDYYAWIPDGCAYFVDRMRAAGIGLTATSFDGGHIDRVIERLAEHMLPFMDRLLIAD